MKRPTPNARKVLEVFVASNYGWVRGGRLVEVGGTRFGARLFELKEFGYAHEKRHDPTSAQPMYRLYPVDRQLTLEEAVA